MKGIKNCYERKKENMKNYTIEKIKAMPIKIEKVLFELPTEKGFFCVAWVDVYNPYCQPFPLCEIHYTLKSHKRTIATGGIPSARCIKGRRTTRVELHMLVASDFIKSIAIDILNDWDIDYELSLSLIFDLPFGGRITIPCSTKGEYKLPTLKDGFNLAVQTFMS